MDRQRTDEKKRIILGQEIKMARHLALMVLEKPEPPFWASFIPMVFFFYAQKLRQYSSGLEEFAENYLLSRRDALEAATVAKITNTAVDGAKLLSKAGGMPETARPIYLKWITLLTNHYLVLLNSHGSCHEELVRSGYDGKAAYLASCEDVIEEERAFNLALLPDVAGDTQDIIEVVQKMNMAIAELNYQEADMIFTSDAQSL
ncbi:MAG: hypothetical protein CVU60_03095 [Deltaproteobacteria bacterium HGW-Deltaproteobacteria-18]|jgi:hypothetical protein|nr:MAG: hypothetical protein CVU60_03095 [Deltaproteobacteria bacterium HGW-Deltaproteobacteria-18]